MDINQIATNYNVSEIDECSFECSDGTIIAEYCQDVYVKWRGPNIKTGELFTILTYNMDSIKMRNVAEIGSAIGISTLRQVLDLAEEAARQNDKRYDITPYTIMLLAAKLKKGVYTHDLKLLLVDTMITASKEMNMQRISVSREGW